MFFSFSCSIFAPLFSNKIIEGGLKPPLYLPVLMITTDHIRTIVGEYLADNEAYLVDVSVSPGNRIIVTIDHPEGLGIRSCVELSRWLEKQLDRDAEDFFLDVTSPGLDQPFKVFRQYSKNIGREVDVKRLDGTRITGKLVSADEKLGLILEEQVREKIEGRKAKRLVTRRYEVPMDQIKETKIVIKF